jgi:hypothetical protein
VYFPRLIRFFLILLLGAAPSLAADLTIASVKPGWRDAASFKRISEYFTGRENTGGRIVLRTRPDERPGYYFLFRAENRGPAREIEIRISVVRPASGSPLLFALAARLPAGESVFDTGLTGPDWPDSDAEAVAWKIEIHPAGGNGILASEKSYLWDNPAEK